MSVTKSTPLHIFIKEFLEESKGKYANRSKRKLIELAKTTYKQNQIEKSLPKNDGGTQKDVDDINKAYSRSKKEGDDLKQEIQKRNSTKKVKEEVEPLDEISRKTLGNYVKAASDEIQDQVSGSSFKSGKAGDLYNKSEDTAKTSKRRKGVETAMNKLTKEDLDESLPKNDTGTQKDVDDINKAYSRSKKEGDDLKQEIQKRNSTKKVKEDLDEKASEKQAQHVADAIHSVKDADPISKEKHMAYLKDNLHPDDYAHIERLLKNEEFEALDELSKETLQSYVGKTLDKSTKGSMKDEKIIGVARAANKIAKKIKAEEFEELVNAVLTSTNESEITIALDNLFMFEGSKEDIMAKGSIFKGQGALGVNQNTGVLATLMTHSVADAIDKLLPKRAAEKEKARMEKKFGARDAAKSANDAVKKYMTRNEDFFEAISEDKLGDAKNILESIFAEKVSNRLKSLKEEVAIEYGKAEVSEARKDAASPYHNTYREALEAGYKHAASKGFDVHDEDTSTTHVDPKPSTGTTKSMHFRLLKNGVEHKKQLHVQVYRREGGNNSSNYETNHYIS